MKRGIIAVLVALAAISAFLGAGTALSSNSGGLVLLRSQNAQPVSAGANVAESVSVLPVPQAAARSLDQSSTRAFTDTPSATPSPALTLPPTATSQPSFTPPAAHTVTPARRKARNQAGGTKPTAPATLPPPEVPVYPNRAALPRGKPGAYAVRVPTPPANCQMYGVNISGGEWGRFRPESPDVYGSDYVYPSRAQLDYYKSKGFSVVRLPVRWEHIQKSLYAPLDSAELARLDSVMRTALAAGVWMWPEPHNNARYYGHLVGSPEVPYDAFADFWGKMAKHLRTQPALYGYDLTDEPHDTGGLWPRAAQAAINAIRLYDMGHPVIVGGDGWSSTNTWTTYNDGLKRLKDPAGKLIFDAHVFFDADGSGRYLGTYDDERAYPDVGVDRARPFVRWLQANKLRGVIGGYGVPNDDTRWLEALDRLLTYMDTANIGGTYWAGGQWWGDYPLSVEPAEGVEQPQMAVLSRHIGGCTR